MFLISLISIPVMSLAQVSIPNVPYFVPLIQPKPLSPVAHVAYGAQTPHQWPQWRGGCGDLRSTRLAAPLSGGLDVNHFRARGRDLRNFCERLLHFSAARG